MAILEFDTKHFYVSGDNFIFNEKERLEFDFVYHKKSSYGTKFQAKKYFKKRLLRILHKAITECLKKNNAEQAS